MSVPLGSFCDPKDWGNYYKHQKAALAYGEVSGGPLLLIRGSRGTRAKNTPYTFPPLEDESEGFCYMKLVGLNVVCTITLCLCAWTHIG